MILFSNPPWWEENGICGVRAGSRWPHTYQAQFNSPDNYRFGEYLPFPFFMGYACSYVRKNAGIEAVLRDSIALRESYNSYFDYIKKVSPEFIVIETATPSWEHDQKVVKKIKELLPSCKIILTGTISATNPEQILNENGLHAIVKGEYEKGCLKALNKGGVIEPMLLTAEEMNSAPFPEYPEETWSNYCDHQPRGQIFPHAQVWASRGCPFKCIFCVWPSVMTGNDPDGKGKRSVRYYSKEYMQEFLEVLLKRFPFKSVYFDDDTFNLGNKHTIEMCEVMQKINLPWSAMCRADTIKLETWKVMKDSGCFGVKLGFESGSQYVVDNIVKKHLDLGEAANVVKHLKEIGMTVHGTFTVGLPAETKEQAMETVKYIKSLELDSHQVSGTAEIEGTPLSTLRKKGELAEYLGAKIDGSYVVEHDGAKKFRKIVEELKEA
jgi:radical SAM superfamily enzyme YgiQ (UPF0313 family)